MNWLACLRHKGFPSDDDVIGRQARCQCVRVFFHKFFWWKKYSHFARNWFDNRVCNSFIANQVALLEWPHRVEFPRKLHPFEGPLTISPTARLNSCQFRIEFSERIRQRIFKTTTISQIMKMAANHQCNKRAFPQREIATCSTTKKEVFFCKSDLQRNNETAVKATRKLNPITKCYATVDAAPSPQKTNPTETGSNQLDGMMVKCCTICSAKRKECWGSCDCVSPI